MWLCVILMFDIIIPSSNKCFEKNGNKFCNLVTSFSYAMRSVTCYQCLYNSHLYIIIYIYKHVRTYFKTIDYSACVRYIIYIYICIYIKNNIKCVLLFHLCFCFSLKLFTFLSSFYCLVFIIIFFVLYQKWYIIATCHCQVQV